MERHIKRAQLLIVIAIAVNLAVFLAVYMMLSIQMSDMNSRVDSVSSRVRDLDQRASERLEGLSEDVAGVSGRLEDRINLTNLLLEQLGEEIAAVGEESRAGIEGIRSELNYTGTINEALDSVVLVVWTDKARIVGSGFFVSGEGHILTADHVVDKFGGKTVRVQTREGDMHVAAVEARDGDKDVAVLRIPLENATPLEFGDSDSLAPGSKVFALGAPEGFAFSATEGIVSAVRRVDRIEDEVGLKLDLEPSMRVVQTDAAITHGNSGGPLIDSNGRVVGLNSFGVSKSEKGLYLDVEGLNFAIASNDVRSVYEGMAS